MNRLPRFASLLILTACRTEGLPELTQELDWRWRSRRAAMLSLAWGVVVTLVCWGSARAMFGTGGSDFRGKPAIRFGPNATAVERPLPGRPHP